MTFPLIKAEDAWALWAVILGGVALSIHLEQKYKWAARLSGPVVALIIAMMLSNSGLMPVEAPVYDAISGYLVPLALPLLMFRADIRDIIGSTGRMFAAFHIASIGTILGAFLAALSLHSCVDRAAETAGVMTGSYIGGSLNFFALIDHYKLGGQITGPLLVADNFIMAGLFMALLLIPTMAWFRKRYPHPHTLEADAAGNRNLAAEHWKRKDIGLLDIAKALAIALGIAAVSIKLSALIAAAIPIPALAALAGNKYMVITLLTVTAATLLPNAVGKINGADELGAYLLYVFLFSIGLPADLMAVIRNTPLLFVFCLIIAVVNLAFTLLVGKWLKFDLEDLLLCVNATLGGPASAAAMAISKGWALKILPAILVGIWGYVIGTFLGVAAAESLLKLLR